MPRTIFFLLKCIQCFICHEQHNIFDDSDSTLILILFSMHCTFILTISCFLCLCFFFCSLICCWTVFVYIRARLSNTDFIFSTSKKNNNIQFFYCFVLFGLSFSAHSACVCVCVVCMCLNDFGLMLETFYYTYLHILSFQLLLAH